MNDDGRVPMSGDVEPEALLSAEQLVAATGVTLPDSPTALWQVIDAATARLGEAELARVPEEAVGEMMEVSERVRRRMDGLAANLYLECSDRSVYRIAGYLTMPLYLSQGLRLGRGESRRRSAMALRITRHHAVSGEELEPKMPAAAAAVADGVIGTAHTLVISEVLNKIPEKLGPEVVADAEERLVEAARMLNPKDTGIVGTHLLAHLDPDGAFTDPADRQRQRALSLLGQNDQLMSKITGEVTPTVRAKLELILNRWAAPGVNNPEDPESPHGTDDTETEAGAQSLADARARDTRGVDQRNHDALEAMCDFVIANQGLGRPDRIPAELVITVSDEDLARRAGMGLTTTGTLIPVSDLIELAAKNEPTSYLAVFRHHTREPLYLGRAKKNRFASKAQRLMLFARDGGCTAEGCDAPFIRTQAHHSPDWALGGRTDIDAVGSACGGHNRWVGPTIGQWETAFLLDGPNAGRMVWRPTGSRGPWRLNPSHHPEFLAGTQAHAPPDQAAIAANDARSRIEKELEARLGMTFLAA